VVVVVVVVVTEVVVVTMVLVVLNVVVVLAAVPQCQCKVVKKIDAHLPTGCVVTVVEMVEVDWETASARTRIRPQHDRTSVPRQLQPVSVP